MRILLDTNILIPLEDSSKALEECFSEFNRLAIEHGHTLLVHPGSQEDIGRDADEIRRNISLSRLKKYPFLELPPKPGPSDLAKCGLSQANDNDRVDNEILYAIFKNAANILVSEDREIHKKANLLGVKDRVHYLQQATEFLRRLHAVVPLALPNIQEVPLHSLDVSLPFFDSLREDYSNEKFNAWYNKSAQSGRKAWIHKDDEGDLGALCIYKTEINPIVTDDKKDLPGKTLKLCTFKVGDSVRGRRVGELFLKAAFRYSSDNGIEYIYLHTRPGKQDFLIDFIKNFGFDYFGRYGNDSVYVKEHPLAPPASPLPPLDFHKKYFPHFKCGPAVGKYIVPIQPRFHRILFPDNERQMGLFEPTKNIAQYKVAGNAIRQAYLCHAHINMITEGDILFFYRSGDQKAVTSIGIVEHVGDYSSEDDIMPIVSKRTVYSRDEIREMAVKETKIFLFRLTQHLKIPISFDWLKLNHVVNGNIQTIRRINHESFQKIVTKGAITNCLLAD
jgi:hypothetical protein